MGVAGFWFAQPNEAAALAAALSFRSPKEGNEGKSRGSAYFSRPEEVGIGAAIKSTQCGQ